MVTVAHFLLHTGIFLSVFHISWIFFKTNVFNQLAQIKIVVVTNTVHMVI